MWYVLERDNERQIIFVTEGCDPLFGHGSWNLSGGPFASYAEAVQYIRNTYAGRQ